MNLLFSIDKHKNISKKKLTFLYNDIIKYISENNKNFKICSKCGYNSYNTNILNYNNENICNDVCKYI